MYLYIRDLPSFTPTCAQTVFTECVSAVVSEMSPNCSPPKLDSGTPSITLGDFPLRNELGVNLPLSSAAVAVTTLKVDPGG